MWSQLELHTWVLNNSLMLSQVSVVTGGNFRKLYKSTAHFWGPKVQHSLPLKSYLSKLKVVFQASCFWELLNSWGCPNGPPETPKLCGSMGQPRQAHAAGSTMSWPQFFSKVPNEEKSEGYQGILMKFIARIFYYHPLSIFLQEQHE